MHPRPPRPSTRGSTGNRPLRRPCDGDAGGWPRSARSGQQPADMRRAALFTGLLVGLLVVGGCGGSAPRPGGDLGRPAGLVDVRTITYKSSFDGSEVTGLAAVPRGVKPRGCVIW